MKVEELVGFLETYDYKISLPWPKEEKFGFEVLSGRKKLLLSHLMSRPQILWLLPRWHKNFANSFGLTKGLARPLLWIFQRMIPKEPHKERK